MIKFIKENWFKVFIIIILLMCFVVGSYFIKNKHSLEVSMKCGSDAGKFFENYKLNKVGYSPKFDEPLYHFNNQLNTCLLTISYQDSTHESLGKTVWDISYSQVSDVYSNKVLISTENYKNDNIYQQKEVLLMSQ